MIKALIVSALIITPVSANVYIESDSSGCVVFTHPYTRNIVKKPCETGVRELYP